MPWVEVRCPNECCPGRERSHPANCICRGSGKVPRDDQPGYVDCEEEDEIIPERWQAFWRNATLTQPAEWDVSIHCPACGEEGEDVPD